MPRRRNDMASRIPEIETKLRAAWRKERRFGSARAILALLAWAAALLLVELLVDWQVLLPAAARMGIVCADGALLLTVAYVLWIRRLRRFDPLRVALRVESRHPELASLLVSYVQLDEARPDAFSPSLVRAVRRDAEIRTQPLDFREIVDVKTLARLFVLAGIAVLLAGAVGIAWPGHVSTFLERLAHPSSGAAYPTRTRIESVTGDRTVRLGDPVAIEAAAGGVVPEAGELAIRPEGGDWERVTMARGEGTAFAYRFEAVLRSFSYQVRIGDAAAPIHEVRAIPPPRIVEARVTLGFPAYTGIPPREVDTLNLEIPEGTAIEWCVRCDRSLARATIVLEEGPPAVRIPMAIGADGRSARCALGRAARTFGYRFSWIEASQGYAYDEEVRYAVRVLPDVPPAAEILRPGGDEKATVRIRLPIAFRARDDHGLAEARIAWTLDGGVEERRPIGALAASLVESEYVWDVPETIPGLREGAVVTYAIEVADHRAGEGGPGIGRSRSHRVAIVGDGEVLGSILDRKAKLIDELKALQGEETEASAQVERLKDAVEGVGERLDLAGRLLDEAERQHAVAGRMGAVIEKLRGILRDLVANDLVEQGDAGEIRAHVATLERVSARNVRRTADLLETARRVRATAPESLDGASREIEAIVEELARILAEAGARYRREELLAELGMLIGEEERACARTRAWEEALRASTERAEKIRPGLVRMQDRLAGRAGRFVERLGAAREAEDDPGERLSLDRAHAILAERGVQGLLAGAARDIEDKDAAGAFERQLNALAALREAARILRGQEGEEGIREALEKIEGLLAEAGRAADRLAALRAFEGRQRQLLERTEAMGGAREPFESLAPRQTDLREDVDGFALSLPDSPWSVPMGQPLANATGAMEEAAEALGANRLDGAVPAEARALDALRQAQKWAEQELAAIEGQLPFALQAMGLEQVRRRFETLLAEQARLRGEAQASAAEGRDAKRTVPLQTDVRDATGRLAQGIPPLLPIRTSLDRAGQEMTGAAGALERNLPEDAAPAQARAEGHLQEAIQGVGDLLAQLEQMWRQYNGTMERAASLADRQQRLMQSAIGADASMLPPLAAPQGVLAQETMAASRMPFHGLVPFPQASLFMRKAMDALAESEREAALGAQHQALDALLPGMRGIEAMLDRMEDRMEGIAEGQVDQDAMARGMMAMMGLGPMGMQGMMGMLAMMGLEMGMSGLRGIPGMSAVAMPGSTAMESADGMRMFSGATPAGPPVGPGEEGGWTPLGPRERDALLERYARELPVEYRRLLEEYYEALAK
ncbi:MAG: DUF4175 family protein [Planctomycetes bacterium]|nr:DUF4175 family protein [Planctomycetota bacterium]